MLKISHKITLAFINFTPEFLQLPLSDKSVLADMQTEMFLFFFCQKYYSQFTTRSDKHIKQWMKTFMIHFTYQERNEMKVTRKSVFKGKIIIFTCKETEREREKVKLELKCHKEKTNINCWNVVINFKSYTMVVIASLARS